MSTKELNNAMTTVLGPVVKFISGYWNFLYPIFFFWRPTVLSFGFTLVMLISVIRLIITGAVGSITLSFFGVIVEVPGLYGYFTPTYYFVAWFVSLGAFLFLYLYPLITPMGDSTSNQKRHSIYDAHGVVSKNFPVPYYIALLISVVSMILLCWAKVAW